MDLCDDCGFDFVSVTSDDVRTRVVAASRAIGAVLIANPVLASERPAPDRWSAAEYGAHVQYGFPDPQTRTLLWMGLQAIHECEHHLGDIEENARLLAGT